MKKNKITDQINQIPNYEPIPQPITFARKTSVGNASYAYHRHDACEIILFLSGNIRLYIEQYCFSPLPGSLVILNPNEMHRIQSLDDSPYERIVLNIRRSYMERLSPDDFSLSDCFYTRPTRPPGQQNLRELSPEAIQEFFDLYTGLEKSAAPECVGRTVLRDAYAALLLLFIHRQFQTAGSTHKNTMPDYIKGTMEYMDAHLSEPLQLSTLASLFHLSGGYLSTQFKLHTGLTLRAYLLDRKINRAKQLLSEGCTVTEACYQSGFNDYANFLRSFKKAAGISPGKYRSLHSTEH